MLALWHVLVVRSASGVASRANWHPQSVFPGLASAAGTTAADGPKGRAKTPSTSIGPTANSRNSVKSPAETGASPDSTAPNWR